MSQDLKQPNGTDILRVDGLSKKFGGLKATDGVNFSVQENSITALIGPNGAGKTTVFNLITNIFPPDEGTVAFFGKQIAGWSPMDIANLGLIRTFQSARVFPGLTVLENVMVGRHRLIKSSDFGQMLWSPESRREEMRIRSQALAMLKIVGLERFKDAHAVDLPMGAQKLLEVVRAVMGSPRLLCLDEPAAGLNDTETEELAALLRAIRAAGISILVVEHNMSLVMNVADRPRRFRETRRSSKHIWGGSRMPLLELKGVSAGYTGASVLNKITLSLDAGEIATLVGSNGAGKSTIAKLVSGILTPMQGEVIFDGKSVKGLSASDRLRLGIAHVPEGRQIFGGMTVLENLRLGACSFRC